jgi:pyruvate,water dikinase
MPNSLTAYRFPGPIDPDISAIGGKAMSLVRTSNTGLPVPPGFILPVAFFQNWIDQLKSKPEWADISSADAEKARKACDALKTAANELSYTEEQNQCIARSLQDFSDSSYFAVRSSSPEEDLETVSFAGIYETVLGVTKESLDSAIKRAFASCLDFRVISYKRQHSLAADDPKIAVVVQELIASQVSGVGFSLNPVTNNYDEVVLTSNWGLGETVVGGLVSPDSLTVDKLTLKVKENKIGNKEFSLCLGGDGEVRKEWHYRSNERTLSDAQAAGVTKLVSRVEGLYGKPMDIEWAIAGNKLYLLQARPITTYVPLPAQLITEPGKKKRLYLDATLCVQAIYKPISVMGTSVLEMATRQGQIRVFGRLLPSEPDRAPFVLAAGRMYLIASNVITVVRKQRFVKAFSNIDPLSAQAISSVNDADYFKPRRRKTGIAFGFLRYVSLMCVPVFKALLNPEKFLAKLDEEEPRFRNDIGQLNQSELSLNDYARLLFVRALDWIIGYVAPCFLASRISFELIKKLCGSQHAADTRQLDQALPRNRTVEMGLALYELSKSLPPGLEQQETCEALDFNSLSVEFGKKWADFLDRYGHRCAGELDIASPRYRDDPKLLLNQIRTLRLSSTDEDNPEIRYARNREQRQAAYERLSKALAGSWRLPVFKRLYRVWQCFGGIRETPKFFLIYTLDQLRSALLAKGQELVNQGRLDTAEQIFDLTLDDLQSQVEDNQADLREIGKRNREPADLLRRVPRLPAVIDSRGLIVTAPLPKAKPGEVVGMPISSGITQGRIKVLNTPNEKPFNRGEILVATATDPGWTPLFVNAAAVVLEVGGMLQHGALVAREYGLPCVAGIANATTLWKDGTLVEVDGSRGIVRLVDGNSH